MYNGEHTILSIPACNLTRPWRTFNIIYNFAGPPVVSMAVHRKWSLLSEQSKPTGGRLMIEEMESAMESVLI